MLEVTQLCIIRKIVIGQCLRLAQCTQLKAIFASHYLHEVITTNCIYSNGEYRQIALIGFGI